MVTSDGKCVKLKTNAHILLWRYMMLKYKTDTQLDVSNWPGQITKMKVFPNLSASLNTWSLTAALHSTKQDATWQHPFLSHFTPSTQPIDWSLGRHVEGAWVSSTNLTGGCWELSPPLLVDPPLELSLFHDSEKRPLVVGRPGPDVPDATDASSRVENGLSLRNSLRSVHFFLEAIGVEKLMAEVWRAVY